MLEFITSLVCAFAILCKVCWLCILEPGVSVLPSDGFFPPPPLILLPPTFFLFFGKGSFLPIIKQVKGLFTVPCTSKSCMDCVGPNCSCMAGVLQNYSRDLVQNPSAIAAVWCLCFGTDILFPFTDKPACSSDLQSCHLDSHWMTLGCEMCFRLLQQAWAASG